jgi:hypothetical protein
MQQIPQIDSPQPIDPRSKRAQVMLSVFAVLAIAAGSFYFLREEERPAVRSSVRPRLPFGPAEQAYAPRVRIENITLSRAENFLHQEITTLSGEVMNGGDRSLGGLELTLEFSDEMHQLVLREARSVVEPAAGPLAPGERRAFEIAIEHVPSLWNMEKPVVRVSGLQFSSTH